MTQTASGQERETRTLDTPEENPWATPTGPETEDVTTGPIDWQARIEAIERRVCIRTATAEEEQPRKENAGHEEKERPHWRVDWDAVSETEA